jgi:FKBP-type peptidyl-prolyl cis-trans isomerase FkpA
MLGLRSWKRSSLLALTLLLLAAPSGWAKDEKEVKPVSEDDKAFYALGAHLGRQLKPLSLNPRELEMLQLGMSDSAMRRELAVEPADQAERINAIRMERLMAAARSERLAGQALLEEAANAEGAVRTSSGLVYREVSAGTGEAPGEKSVVKVHYHGTLRDGSVFDSSVQRNEPAQFPLERVIPCWTEGLQLMKVGGKSHLTCPPELAYGDAGFPPGIPGGATLSFDVELLEIVTP